MVYSVLDYFTPRFPSRENSARYGQLRLLLTLMLAGSDLLAVLLIPAIFFLPFASSYYLVVLACIAGAFTIKYTGWTLMPCCLTILVCYSIVFWNVLHTGGLSSPHLILFHLLLIPAVWVDPKRVGIPLMFINMISFFLIAPLVPPAGY